MSAKADNARTQDALRGRAAAKRAEPMCNRCGNSESDHGSKPYATCGKFRRKGGTP